LLSYSHLLNYSISQRTRIAFTFALALFSIAFGISTTPAQNRARRSRQEPQKNARRDNDKKRDEDKKRTLLAVRDRKRADEQKRNEDKKRASLAGNRRAVTTDRRLMTSERRPSTTETRRTPLTEAASRDNSRQVMQNPLVRRTALTYTPRTPEQPSNRPVLVNDITVVSRMSDKPSSPVLMTVAPRAGSATANVPSIWPVMGTLRSGVGMRGNPFGGSGTEYHKGQDIAAPMGTPVMATADGTIITAGWQRGYGWVVYIDHGNGITTRYGHLSRIDVELGQTIRRGQQLGLVGSTGRSTGPHLHYEVRINGQPVSPLLYLPGQTALSSVSPQSATVPAGQR
jgi:murein DD-endopeptidase MepM/ murein hydrolase activator NlpD